MSILQNFKSHWPLILLHILVLLLFLAHVTGNMHWRFIDQMENYAYDARMIIGMEKDQDPRIVIIDIDEKSLAEEGRWPWGRNKMALLLNELFDYYKVALVGFDIVFAEPDESSGLKILEKLAEDEFSNITEFVARLKGISEELDYDLVFANSMIKRPVVLGYYFNPAREGAGKLESGILPEPVFSNEDFQGRDNAVLKARGFGANLPALQEQASGAGHFNPSIDNDGIVRRVPMLYEYEDYFYESLSLSMYRHILDVKKIELVFGGETESNYTELEWLNVGDQLIPVDKKAQVMVPYRGRQGSFPYISATDVLRGRVESSRLENAIVLIGTSAPGLFDLRSTPVQNKYPGVEIHANLIAGLLDERIKKRPAYVVGAEFANLIIVGLIIGFLLPVLTPIWAAFTVLVLLIISIGFNYFIWQQVNLVLPLASIVIMILIMFLLNMSYGFFIERRRKGEIAGLFGQYVPPELVDEMSVDPQSFSFDAEEREMTVLFSDVRGFTTLSEGLNPKELSNLMNEYLTPLTSIIHQYRGTIDKYMGDAIMAFWGAPIKDTDHALHALEAGLAMIEKMYALRDEFLERGWPELRIGVGINSGVMSVGNMGSEFRMAYTVIGDAVNLGSRLEGLTKQYGVDLLVGETTKEALNDYVFRKLDQVRVKGKEKPVAIYEPLGKTTEVSTEELDELKLYNQALNDYLSQEWNMASKRFLNLQRMYVERKLYKLYLERVDYFTNNPPGKDWDGVFTFTTK